MTTVRSIDGAANGYVRHRFLRALAASFVVGATFGILALTLVGTVHALTVGDAAVALVAPLGVLMVLAIFLLPIMLIVAFAGGIIDILHRRLVGFALFLLGLVGMLTLIIGVIYAGGTLAGFDMTTPTNPEPMPTRDALAFGAFSIVGALVCFEILIEGWWQLTVNRDSFRAVRGWRPPSWRLLSAFRRYLGLPSFLSYVGKKRRIVTLLYFGVAVLNLGLLTVVMLPPLLGGADVKSTSNFDPAPLYTALALLLLLNLAGVGNLLARVADKRATGLYQRVRDWDARPPIVFLRAFDQDDHKLKCRGGDPFARWPAGVGRSRTLDEILLEHASPYGPVIAIGDPRDATPPLGAARVFVPGEGSGWQDVVRGLAAASKAVVMCPNSGEGVQWELDLIAQAQGRLRVIFLASPDLDREANVALFQRLVPQMPDIKAKHAPLAAYECDGAWRVLTAKRLSVESYTAALNMALQSLFGARGSPVTAPR